MNIRARFFRELFINVISATNHPTIEATTIHQSRDEEEEEEEEKESHYNKIAARNYVYLGFLGHIARPLPSLAKPQREEKRERESLK